MSRAVRSSDALTRILDFETPASTIVFCARKSEADSLGESLQGRGYSAEVLHGDLNQTQRDRVMNRFRSGQVEILVATDVAARGLDIPDVSHVINYDIPWDPESYVHRIGRTGRAGREGDAITLVTPREQRQLRTIERVIGQRLKRLRLPSPADVAARRREAVMDQIRSRYRRGRARSLSVHGRGARRRLRPGRHRRGGLQGAGRRHARARRGRRPADGDGSECRGGAGHDAPVHPRGRRAGIRPMDIVGAIANEAGVSAEPRRLHRPVRQLRLRRGAQRPTPTASCRPSTTPRCAASASRSTSPSPRNS